MVVRGKTNDKSTAEVTPPRTHATSMAVWDIPSPIVRGTMFTIKAGVRCPKECALAGGDMEVYDQNANRVANGKLGDAAWPAASALYWGELHLEAPAIPGFFTWTARFRGATGELSHEGTAYSFGFAVVGPPEHMLTVEVIDRDKKTPIEDANVILSPYRGQTDERGVARVETVKGRYDLYVLKRGLYKDFKVTVEVAGDLAVKAELTPEPPEDEAAGYA